MNNANIPWSTVAFVIVFVAAIVVTNIFAPGTTAALVASIATIISGLGLRAVTQGRDASGGGAP